MSVSSSNIEERIIALEREIWRLPDLNERRIRLTAFEQQLAQVAMYTPSTVTPPANTIPGCSAPIATTIYVRDPVYGAVTLQWDGVSMWTACKSINYFGYSGTCAAANGVAVWYDLLTTAQYQMRWISAAPTGNKCPQAFTSCSGTPNVTATTPTPVNIESCNPFRASILIGPSSGGFVIYGSAVNAGVRIDFSESPL